MNSIGILYTLRNSSEPSKINVSAELHVNYWKVPTGKGNYKRFLDFGIFINEVAREISSVSFYWGICIVPWIKKLNFYDNPYKMS